MAELRGILSKLRGSAGQFTFKRVNGHTIMSEKASITTVRRSRAQQLHRMKWPNLIKTYAGIAPLLNCAFESKSKSVSDYNMFVKVNSADTKVYLTKSEVVANACVVAPYQITMGSLPTIQCTGEAGASATDINLGKQTLTADTTVKQFSDAVVSNNPAFDYGDQIAFICVAQGTHPVTGYPQCDFTGESIVLEKRSEVKLRDCVGEAGFSAVGGKLACKLGDGFQGAYAWVHSRKQQGTTRVSTQMLIAKNDLLDSYTSEEAYKRAVATYGGEDNNFLTPDGNSTAKPVPSEGGGSEGDNPDSL